MIHTPYLIQRAQINIPLVERNARVSEAVKLDYMGSAEFEFGALAKSLRRIEAMADTWICRLVPDITENNVPLRVWSALTDEEFEEYKIFLHRLRDPDKEPLRTKESVRFEADYEHSKYNYTDFWWDINNDAMFGFKKEFMKRVGDYVASSITYMNAQKI